MKFQKSNLYILFVTKAERRRWFLADIKNCGIERNGKYIIIQVRARGRNCADCLHVFAFTIKIYRIWFTVCPKIQQTRSPEFLRGFSSGTTRRPLLTSVNFPDRVQAECHLVSCFFWNKEGDQEYFPLVLFCRPHVDEEGFLKRRKKGVKNLCKYFVTIWGVIEEEFLRFRS